MKKMRKAMILILAFLVTACGSPVYAGEEQAEMFRLQEEHAQVCNFGVSNKYPAFGETVTVSFDLTLPAGKEVVQFSVGTMNTLTNSSIGLLTELPPAFAQSYHYEGSLTVQNYGETGIGQIFVSYIDGTTDCFYDSVFYADVNNVDPEDLVDMSGSRVIIENPDTQNPVIYPNTIQFTQIPSALGENAIFTVMVTDDYALNKNVISICFAINGVLTDVSYSFRYNELQQLLEITYPANRSGTHELVYIGVTDAAGNRSMVANQKYRNSINAYDDTTYIDLSDMTFTINQYADDNEPPVIDLASVVYPSGKIQIKTSNVLSFSVTDNGKVLDCYALVRDPRGGGAFISSYQENEQICHTDIYTNYYGTYSIDYLWAEDSNNNLTVIYDTGYPANNIINAGSSSYNAVNIQYADFSQYAFEVGILDQATGVYVLGEGLEEDSKLTVEPKDETDASYDKLYQSGNDILGFFNLLLSGNWKSQGISLRLDFPVKLKDNTPVTIRHLHDNGSVEEFHTVVYNGIASIVVGDLSPFMLLTESEDSADEGEPSGGEKQTETEKPDTYSGFRKTGNQWKWYQKGKFQSSYTGIAKGTIDGKTASYYVKNGVYTKENGWKKLNNKWYYLNSAGIMQTGWVQAKNKWYYLSSSGVMQTGWQQVKSKWYYLNSSGVMQTGWVKSGGKWYYLNSSGIMQTGWVQVKGKWYYLDNSGAMTTGWQKISGKWYYLNNSGVMQTGWQQVKGKWYYLNSSGIMQTGWLKSGSKWYYLGTSGAMTIGWQKVSGKWYYLNSSGIMQTGWLKLSGKWYYLDSTGVMVTGTQTIGGKNYTFDAGGVWVN